MASKDCPAVVEKVRAALATLNLRADRAIVVGVSAGADSTALLDALHRLGYPLIAAHYHHGLRKEADKDAATIAGLAKTLQIPLVIGRAADETTPIPKKGIEEAARRLRYRFLYKVAQEHRAQAIAVAHTYDDRSETVLMHILRGTGIHGLAAMRPRVIIPEWDKNIPLIRPMLRVRRYESIAYCRCRGLPVRWDLSNWQREYLRNRLRLDIIPLLQTENPSIAEALFRLSEVAAAEDDFLHNLARERLEKLLKRRGKDYLGLDAKALLAEHKALQRRIVRLAAHELGITELPLHAVEEALALTRMQANQPAQWQGGLTLLAEQNFLWIARSAEAIPLDAYPQLPTKSALPVKPGDTIQLANGWLFALSEPQPLPNDWRARSTPRQVWLDAAALTPPLNLRSPAPGDRIAPLGMGGKHQKLSDLFTNAKVPRRARLRWPVLWARDEVLWVPLLRVSEAARITPATRLAVRARVYKPADEAPPP